MATLSMHPRYVAQRAKSIAALKEVAAQWGATVLEETYHRNALPFRFICRCGQQHQMVWGHIQQQKSKVLCPTCSKAERPRGEGHPNYDPTIKDRTKRIHLPGAAAWAKKVKEDANYICFISGKRGVYLSSHHLYSYGAHPELRLEPSNGVCITRELHKKFHRLYGNHVNTFGQFAEFYEAETGQPCPLKDPRS